MCRACNNARLGDWRSGHPTNVSKNSRNGSFRVAGIINANGTPFTTVDYDRAYQVQQGKCKGCYKHQSELGRRLDADHDHKTGVFRFLLCANCNRALGYAKDNPDILHHLAELVEHISEDHV
jgi:hypothetical protein